MSLSPSLQRLMSDHFFPGTPARFSSARLQSVGGGSINRTYRLLLPEGRTFFCKINSATKFPHLFRTEAAALGLLAAPGILRVPSVAAVLEDDSDQVLLLEWIGEGRRTDGFWDAFGRGLAALHRQPADRFGGSADNYMGSVPQRNGWMDDWCAFFIERRLQPMVAACDTLLPRAQRQALEGLYPRLAQFFPPGPPALVHGDLWSGNFLCDESSAPVLVDPAAYYGHRSVDLGMTTLFGGFASRFYEAYDEVFPLPPDHEEQWALCNLYPLLIHLYLFGTSYLGSIARTLKRFQ